MQQSDIGVYGNQVGGSCLLLTEKGGSMILKPFSKCEGSFYHRINSSPIDCEKELMNFLPKYGGTVEFANEFAIKKQSSDWLSHLPTDKYEQKKKSNKIVDHHYVRLENLTFGMTAPCVLDVKIGIRKWKASHAKFQHSTTPTHGFRLNGCEVYQHSTGHKLFRNKYFYHTISYEDLLLQLAVYFYDGSTIDRWVLNELALKLDELIEVFSQVRGMLFESLSLFICYEGSQQHQRKVVLKLIDFGHVLYEGNEVDTNRLHGITQFRKSLAQVTERLAELEKALSSDRGLLRQSPEEYEQ